MAEKKNNRRPVPVDGGQVPGSVKGQKGQVQIFPARRPPGGDVAFIIVAVGYPQGKEEIEVGDHEGLAAGKIGKIGQVTGQETCDCRQALQKQGRDCTGRQKTRAESRLQGSQFTDQLRGSLFTGRLQERPVAVKRLDQAGQRLADPLFAPALCPLLRVGSHDFLQADQLGARQDG